MTVFNRVRVLPLLILVASIAFLVRLGELQSGLRSAFAQEEVKVNPPEFPAAPEDKEADKGKDKADAKAPPESPEKSADKAEAGADGKKPDEAAPEKKAEETREWKDSSGSDLDYSSVRMELFEDLKSRRKVLEDREKQLSAREALLKAGERELDQKFRELTVLKKEIEGLLQQQSDEEQARLKSLVMIYEGMKPKEAARVFDTLDMDVLVSIISRMAERKASPVLAEMNPERARAVTIILAQEKQLPTMPGPDAP